MGLQRRLFFAFGVGIVLSGLAFAGVSKLVGNPSERWHRTLDGARSFVAARFAEAWSDAARRSALADELAQALSIGLVLRDPAGQLLSRHGKARCRKPRSTAIVEGGKTLGRVDACVDPWEHMPLSVLLAFFAAALALWGVAGVLARRLARPLGQVARVAQAIGEGELSRRYTPGRGATGEVEQLADAINLMAERIGKQLGDQRELLAAVSHELRTPLGHLRVLIELAREGNLDAARLTEMEREVREIDELVGDLLAHSRLEFSGLSRQRLDAVTLAAEALERQGLPVDLLESESEAVELEADASLLARALANLLDNAERHGSGVRALRVRSDRDDEGRERVCFEVDDEGPGFGDDLQRPFGAFVGGAGHGLGLGLALVARIAQAHGGRAWASHRAGGGARVTICLER